MQMFAEHDIAAFAETTGRETVVGGLIRAVIAISVVIIVDSEVQAN